MMRLRAQVAQLSPFIFRPVSLAGCYKGKIQIVGDIVGAFGESWGVV